MIRDENRFRKLFPCHVGRNDGRGDILTKVVYAMGVYTYIGHTAWTSTIAMSYTGVLPVTRYGALQLNILSLYKRLYQMKSPGANHSTVTYP